MDPQTGWLAAAMSLAALLYSSVGHGGASAYLALMAIAGVEVSKMRTIALSLNILVAGLGAIRYARAGRFQWNIFWPFAVTAIPMSFLAGRIELDPSIYRPLLAAVLALAALRYLVWPKLDAVKEPKPPRLLIALPAGALLGAMAGLTGTGGGIFLSPLLVFAGWTDAKGATGIAASFIVVNSMAGLAGRLSTLQSLPPELPIFAAAAVIGGIVGTTLSLRFFSTVALLRALGVVLLVASIGLIAFRA